MCVCLCVDRCNYILFLSRILYLLKLWQWRWDEMLLWNKMCNILFSKMSFDIFLCASNVNKCFYPTFSFTQTNFGFFFFSLVAHTRDVQFFVYFKQDLASSDICRFSFRRWFRAHPFSLLFLSLLLFSIQFSRLLFARTRNVCLPFSNFIWQWTIVFILFYNWNHVCVLFGFVCLVCDSKTCKKQKSKRQLNEKEKKRRKI